MFEYKPRQILILLLALFICFALSCSRASRLSQKLSRNIDDQGKEVAMKVVAEYRLQSFSFKSNIDDLSSIDNPLTKASVNGDIDLDEIYEEKDTLYTSTEIPFEAFVSEVTEISAEGEVEYVQEIELDTTSCPLLCFYEESLNLDEYIAKIEIKDGKFRSYNRRGEVLSEIEAEVPNMEGFVNEIQRLIEEAEAEHDSLSKSKAKRDINWLRNRLNDDILTKGSSLIDASVYGPYNVYETDNGNVVYEQSFNATKSSRPYISRVTFSPDIMRSLSYEKIDDGKVVERQRMVYADDHTCNSVIICDSSTIERDLPIQVVTERISGTTSGTINVTNQRYITNNTYVYGKVVKH